ncbi:MAG: methionine--tRNA ligase [Chthoniobacterales bacterium]|nr:methionine--tRNA ligase [Chthoniobacterales bacterium]
MPESFYICTAIDYTNGAPHIGHAYEKVLADVIARYRRLKGEDVFFLTGVDQHGQKVQQSAEQAGISPEKFVAQNTAKFVALWKKLDIRYDGWAATIEPQHKKCVQKILARLHDEGQLYKASQGGHYSVRQEQFLTDKERGPDGEFGPEWGKVEYREEENYYFKLARHKEWLLGLLDKDDDLITPAFRRAELRNAVAKLSGDLCVSRPKARLSWGIEFPFDPEFVTYVWFDALVNYISFAPGGYDPTRSTINDQPSTFREWWPATIVIGKDILIPAHGIYWMIMLHALGFLDDEMPRLVVHGWWNISGAKMSKSLGNVVDPDKLADSYGAEALRYYLMADISTTGKDAEFSEERLIVRYNTELANSLGNLLNRTINMAQRYRDGVLRKVAVEHAALARLAERVPEICSRYSEAMVAFQVDAALREALALAGQCNLLVESMAPWKLAKNPAETDLLDAVLYHLAEAVRIIAILVAPVLPEAAKGIFVQLNCAAELSLGQTDWGRLLDGHRLGTARPLFPRIETAPAGRG